MRVRGPATASSLTLHRTSTNGPSHRGFQDPARRVVVRYWPKAILRALGNIRQRAISRPSTWSQKVGGEVNKGRLFILGASVLWSLGGVLAKEIGLAGAPWPSGGASCSGGLAFLPFVPARLWVFRPGMLPLSLAFAATMARSSRGDQGNHGGATPSSSSARRSSGRSRWRGSSPRNARPPLDRW